MRKNLELYLSRPFTLFGASVWNEWYVREHLEQLIGVRFTEGVFIESPRGIACCYRLRDEIAAFKSAIAGIALQDIEQTRALLARAEALNAEAERLVKKGSSMGLEQTLDAFIVTALHAGVFPLFAGELLAMRPDAPKDVLVTCEKLREISYYPQFLKQVVVPAARRAIVAASGDPADIEYMTIRELLAGNVGEASKRRARSDLYFILEHDRGKETVSQTPDPASYLASVDDQTALGGSLNGAKAYGGFATGVARLVLTHDPNAVTFNEGDILVAISTNPSLLPLMKKAGAIVTDEGGMLSHAAIISRELGKPCVVGTKRAIRLFKDGDRLEVDAERGIVRKI